MHASLFKAGNNFPNGVTIFDLMKEFKFGQFTRGKIPGKLLAQFIEEYRDKGNKRFIQVDDKVPLQSYLWRPFYLSFSSSHFRTLLDGAAADQVYFHFFRGVCHTVQSSPFAPISPISVSSLADSVL